ncbi:MULTISPECIES: LysR family transcriptional regulator [Halomonadaceae]|jgi:DNA-binding transcriptional LysR family regulator|uniref:LysR family transcriptional regulator n=1 Tax=Halomonadaceae TaxID=28256 RepID=UPI0012F0270F|nr:MULTISPECIES: LysR family transcriptional regulator [Halomonas]CAD5250209.1 LysR family transcriptional regulator [Halomonas sp. I3]CAD5273197.1 LysR family transcriptional regulator [Halomonas sp. 113]CAD5274991.1 LysR family transcriptional regulator [Halomonas sp. 59]CAD5278573.1 LysR family transcriptional regulator [Halomonas sp. 156]VXB91170.1 LysR family transcriptional regulator [Halomonas titanicae]
MSSHAPLNNEGFNSRRMRYAFEAMTQGSIRRAADKLDIEASVISRQIARLEAELGVRLLERHGRGVRATEAGELLLDFHRERQAAESALLSDFSELDNLSRGSLRLAISEGYSATLMSEVINNFSQQHPKLYFEVTHASVNQVVTRVMEGDAHIGLAYSPRLLPGVQSIASARQPVCAVMHPDHPLNKRSLPLSLDDVLQYPLGLISKGYGLRQLVDTVEIIDKRHFTPSLVSNSLATLKQYVSAGHAVTFMPAVALKHELARSQLVALPIAHQVFIEAESHLIVRQHRPLSLAASRLINEICRIYPFSTTSI